MLVCETPWLDVALGGSCAEAFALRRPCQRLRVLSRRGVARGSRRFTAHDDAISPTKEAGTGHTVSTCGRSRASIFRGPDRLPLIVNGPAAGIPNKERRRNCSLCWRRHAHPIYYTAAMSPLLPSLRRAINGQTVRTRARRFQAATKRRSTQRFGPLAGPFDAFGTAKMTDGAVRDGRRIRGVKVLFREIPCSVEASH